MNTSNILFICGGAFDGLDKIIEKRTDRSAIGFDAPVQSKQDRDVGQLLAQVQPHDLLKFGIIPELVGRLPVITSLQSLKKEDLIRILVEPKNALTKQYTKLLGLDHVDLEIQSAALERIAEKAVERQIGARGLRAVMERHDQDHVRHSFGFVCSEGHHYAGVCRWGRSAGGSGYQAPQTEVGRKVLTVIRFC